MSETRTGSKSSRILAVLIALLIVVVAVESYEMLRLERALHRGDIPQVAVTSTARADAPGSKAAAKDPKKWIEPQADPFGSWLDEDWWSSPFDSKNWTPFAEMRRMRERIDRLFNDAFSHFRGNEQFDKAFGHLGFSPGLDLQETADSYIVRFDLPGMEKSKINVRLKDRTLTVSGSREENVEKKKGSRVLRSEVLKGRFERSVLLPGPVKSEGLKAKYENGVLEVTVPKSTKRSTAKRIEIL